MECNKEEALRSKAIAEKRFTRKDIFGARKFAVKAQALYPELEGIQQMIATFDVYIAAENKLYGDSDWYAILNVHPSADDDMVRRHYRKLALLLHPDKNKTIGAEGAFKFVSQAWSLLSDKNKRASYDHMKSKVSQQPSSSVPSASPSTNGFTKFSKATFARDPKGSSKVPPSNTKPKQATFWTACYRCKMQYEYLRKYLNNNLLCPNCRKAFFAIETGPPRDRVVKSPTSQWSFSQQRQNSTHQSENSKTRNPGRNKVSIQKEESANFSTSGSGSQTNYQWNAFGGASSAPTSAQAAVMVQQAYETVRREREEAQAAKKREEVLQRKTNALKRMNSVHQGLTKRRRNMDDAGTSSLGKEFARHMDVEAIVGMSRSKLVDCTTAVSDVLYKSEGGNDISQLDPRYILIEKARKDIQTNLDKVIISSINMEKEGRKTKKQLAGERENEDLVMEGNCIESDDFSIKDDDLLEEGNRLKLSETSMSMFIDVPDSEFHVFRKAFTGSSFEENQVWAAYDNNDGMPRFYAMVHSVVSRDPLKLQISWLNSNMSVDSGLLNSLGSGFVQACGDFRAGSCLKKTDALECFSHKVRWRRGKLGRIAIYPRKGDVWALYRNWSPEWDWLTTDEMITKYDLVEVLEDLTEEGVTTIPLVKVAGFRAVFHRHLDLGQTQVIPKEDLSRFSHYVPSHQLTEAEAQSSLKGCLELDPAAVPSELLQIFSNITEEDVVSMQEDIDHIEMDNMKKTDEADMKLLSVKDKRIPLKSSVIVLDDLDEVTRDKIVGHSEI
uniref:J domain-containing protein n=1 Tax=Kalanchoe fedtschenkoi TaxID=63787 RepID=A0A7N0RCL9_KALFE